LQPRPAPPVVPLKPQKPEYPKQPNPEDYVFRWTKSGIRRVFNGETTIFFLIGSAIRRIVGFFLRFLRLKKTDWAEQPLEDARAKWQAECSAIDFSYQRILDGYERKRREMHDNYVAKAHEWGLANEEHCEKQKAHNARIKDMRERYAEGEKPAVEYFFSEVLSRSDYPENFPQGNTLSFIESNGILVVDFELPNQDALPSIREVKYVATRRTLQEVPLSEGWSKKIYDDVLYQVALRTIHELYTADEAAVSKSIVFNGWVRSIDRSTGIETHACVLSIQAERDEFMRLNLSQVDPRACFRKLKGIASSKLIELTPVRPILTTKKEDRRFVEGYAVAESLDDRTNLAAMDWLDFENLIRELFEKEFSKNGGEVKITRASRDGGVDAIAFDPDPIRGGKIVIQAKRYTNVVGVAAVRDLFGTVHNEGATKGILVTTSTYGADAYEFAKDKPLTLLSGGELLSLLAAHGHRAKIDLQEAKALNLERVATQ
jgi:restriction system protein